MKPQDIGFLIVLTVLLIVRKQSWFVYAGLLCFALAIPLFARWIFFTGERMTWYGAAFVFVSIILYIVRKE
ncbi:MAG: hypothetical protein UT26_C0001G0027 [Microgenomates group bacterium GW2011_GWC1_39_12]|nr:MAG: hypothetical protein UT26_C0001G0027 [Microgenomates group bacterium GW2011_GWC1_39_12]